MTEIATHILVINTCPDLDTAQALAQRLVAGRLAACVNIVGPVRSVYRWRGAVESDDEQILLIKTTQAMFEAVRDTIVRHHPYELPEIIAVPVIAGLDTYLDWLEQGVTPE